MHKPKHNWEDFDTATIMGGYATPGVRYLQLFLKDYKDIFGGKPNGGCRKCINNYLSKYKAMKTKNTNDSGFVLKAKYEGIQIGMTGVTVNNKNMTREMALQLLEVHEPSKIFDKWPEGIENDLEAAQAEEETRKNSETNHQFAITDGLKINADSKEKLIAFADKYKIPLSNLELTKPLLIAEIKAWLDQPTNPQNESLDEMEDEAGDDNTNMQFAKADGFDLATASIEEKQTFIEKYEIPFDAEKEPAYSEDEVNTLISDWLAEESLL